MSRTTLPSFPIARMLALATCLAALAACTPEPPPTEQPPEPQASSRDTALRDAIQAPQQKAAGVEDAVLQGADQQRARIDAEEGG